MNININCIYNDRGVWCINKNVKRSLFGFGARCCILYDNPYHPWDNICKYQVKWKKSSIVPPCPPPRSKPIQIEIKIKSNLN